MLEGYLQTDGYEVYNRLAAEFGSVTHVGSSLRSCAAEVL